MRKIFKNIKLVAAILLSIIGLPIGISGLVFGTTSDIIQDRSMYIIAGSVLIVVGFIALIIAIRTRKNNLFTIGIISANIIITGVIFIVLGYTDDSNPTKKEIKNNYALSGWIVSSVGFLVALIMLIKYFRDKKKLKTLPAEQPPPYTPKESSKEEFAISPII